MSKNITKEQIINTALVLINRKNGSGNVNLREIARELKCAHTNIYNYYDDIGQLIWGCAEAILSQSEQVIINKLSEKKRKHDKLILKVFFETLADFYLENRGWFKLIWLDNVNGEKPPEVRDATARTVKTFKNIICNFFHGEITPRQAYRILHNVHCYLLGEIISFISGRGFITNRQKFHSYVVNECVKMIKLFVFSIKNEKINMLIL